MPSWHSVFGGCFFVAGCRGAQGCRTDWVWGSTAVDSAAMPSRATRPRSLETVFSRSSPIAPLFGSATRQRGHPNEVITLGTALVKRLPNLISAAGTASATQLNSSPSPSDCPGKRRSVSLGLLFQRWIHLQRYGTVIVIRSDITGGVCGTWLASPSSNCSVWLPFGSTR